jgi:hypothetical protein
MMPSKAENGLFSSCLVNCATSLKSQGLVMIIAVLRTHNEQILNVFLSTRDLTLSRACSDSSIAPAVTS